MQSEEAIRDKYQQTIESLQIIKEKYPDGTGPNCMIPRLEANTMILKWILNEE